MSRLSILIPWRETPAAFENTLVSVLANRPENSEVIVVHRGVYEDPYELRREVLLVEHDADASLSDLLNRGLQVAGGDVLHLLACGATVSDGWCSTARQAFAEDATLGSMTPALVNANQPQRLISSGVSLSRGGARRLVGAGRRVQRPPHTGWGPSLLAGFYRLGAVRDVGGFSDTVGESVDADIAASLRQAGYSTKLDTTCQMTYDASVVPLDPEQDHIRHAERLYWRQASQLGWPGAMLHALHALSRTTIELITGKWSPAGARAAAMLELRSYREHRDRIASASNRCGQDPSAVLSLEDERQRRQESQASRRRAA